MLLKVDCLHNAVGKQPSIPLIYLGRKRTLNWWWWWWLIMNNITNILISLHAGSQMMKSNLGIFFIPSLFRYFQINYIGRKKYVDEHRIEHVLMDKEKEMILPKEQHKRTRRRSRPEDPVRVQHKCLVFGVGQLGGRPPSWGSKRVF